jgi:predicted small integral membrane protein
MPDLAWMAWTWQTGVFFATIAGLLLLMTVLALWWPETERVGILRIATSRGDRLFISLLGSAYLFLVWLAILGTPLWGALAIAVVYTVCVFRWV